MAKEIQIEINKKDKYIYIERDGDRDRHKKKGKKIIIKSWVNELNKRSLNFDPEKFKVNS